jgi:acyl-coenzyme A synthetase/AMP-(fatty) acid ligase
LSITGRIKEMINRGGLKVAPGAVDAALLAHPDVQDAATVGVPHRSLGEDVVAAVILKPGATADGEALRRHARGSSRRTRRPAMS